MLFTHPVASRVGVGPEGSCPPQRRANRNPTRATQDTHLSVSERTHNRTQLTSRSQRATRGRSKSRFPPAHRRRCLAYRARSLALTTHSPGLLRHSLTATHLEPCACAYSTALISREGLDTSTPLAPHRSSSTRTIVHPRRRGASNRRDARVRDTVQSGRLRGRGPETGRAARLTRRPCRRWASRRSRRCQRGGRRCRPCRA